MSQLCWHGGEALKNLKAILAISDSYMTEESVLILLARTQMNLLDLGGVHENYRSVVSSTKTLGDFNDARVRLERMLPVIELVRAMQVPTIRQSFSMDVRDYYDLYINTLLSYGADDEVDGRYAFEVLELARSRNILDALDENILAKSSLLKGLSGSREQLISDIVKMRLEERGLLAVGSADTARWQSLRTAITEKEFNLTEIERQTPHSEIDGVREPITSKGVQKALRSDEVLLRFALVGRKCILWIITSDSLKYRRIELGEAVHLLSMRYSASVTGYSFQARRLGQALFGEILPIIRGKRLFIVGDFMEFPFGALEVKSQDGSFRPLVAEFEVSYVPSASMLMRIRNRDRNRRGNAHSIALIGDPVLDNQDVRVGRTMGSLTTRNRDLSPFLSASPDSLDSGSKRNTSTIAESTTLLRLPFARRELDSIASVFQRGSDVIKFTGFDASIDLINRLDHSKFRLFHFATHGVLDADDAYVSKLMLSRLDVKGLPLNGALAATDVLKWTLNAELIVLSACETASGKTMFGEATLGLSEAFIIAGASNVVSSLWKVDDAATAEFMHRFYRHLINKNQSPAAALRATQLEMLSHPVYSDPHFWAAFVVQGAGSRAAR